ncbi:MAG: alpha-amylase [Spirochaetia bacterium]|nr:alpha-amylase [Spirochaetia bacterium]
MGEHMQARDFRIALKAREEIQYKEPLFETQEQLESMYEQAKVLAYLYNEKQKAALTKQYVSAASLHASGVLHLLYQSVVSKYLEEKNSHFFTTLSHQIEKHHLIKKVLSFYEKEFPTLIKKTEEENKHTSEESTRGLFIHHVLIENPALVKEITPFIAPQGVSFPPSHKAFTVILEGYTKTTPHVQDEDEDLFSFLTAPSKAHPDSLVDQIQYILNHWGSIIPLALKKALLHAIDVVKEENTPRFSGGPGPAQTTTYDGMEHEYEAFSVDEDWMPHVVMIAKSALVWLDQLSKTYGYQINTLDKIPDKELDLLRDRGFNGLWLIGIWERSEASKKIKNLCGNPEAEASAYSLKSYNIGMNIGGWSAYQNLNERCKRRHIRLASDMVPNHTGLDSDWALHHPEYFITTPYSPYPSYTFNGEDLSPDSRIEVKIEDHYYDRTDAAVTYRRVNKETQETSYIFHGNDGTSMPWNDTAQLDFLNPHTREAVIQQILHVARAFHIIRFDAAMTLAKRHIQRLWYPKPGSGGDIPGRAGYSMSDEEFNQAIPLEFWREVVDRVASEVPDTLLLAEAFWMMEGYFVRTLGMHRVYNSAFMNMLKNQANKEYRDTIKNTLSFDPEVLKRFVNFMNNPDEDTAIAQFGDGDKYFGVATLLSTMPGLPMYGHGQIEGFHEKYGMEYSRAYWNEYPNDHLINEHYRRIFPLLRLRYLFSGSEYFEIFDVVDYGSVKEDVYAYVNGIAESRALILYNNSYEFASGRIYESAPKLHRTSDGGREIRTNSIAQSLGLTFSDNTFIIYQQFPENLTYIAKSNHLYDEGLSISLQGYETKVFLHVNEVTDVDGSYEALYRYLDGKGTSSFDRDLVWIRMQPLHKALENFCSSNMLDFIKDVVTQKEVTSKDMRKYVLLAGEAYARFSIVYEELSDKTKESIVPIIKEVQPKDLLQSIQNFTACFIPENNIYFFLSGGMLMKELSMLINASLLITIFVDQKSSYEQALSIVDKLALERMFQHLASSFEIDVDYRLRHLLYKSIFLATLPPCIMKELELEAPDNKKCLIALLEDRGFRELIGYNEHAGIIYYRKESLQEAIYLITLSVTMNVGPVAGDRMIKMAMSWLLSDASAEYKIEGLIKGVK